MGREMAKIDILQQIRDWVITCTSASQNYTVNNARQNHLTKPKFLYFATTIQLCVKVKIPKVAQQHNFFKDISYQPIPLLCYYSLLLVNVHVIIIIATSMVHLLQTARKNSGASQNKPKIGSPTIVKHTLID